MKLFIKHMVSLRCKMIVREELQKLGLKVASIDLGVVVFLEKITEEQRELVKTSLEKWGFELIDDRKTILVERTKALILEMVHSDEGLTKIRFSDYLSDKLRHDYTYLSNIFTESQGITLHHYIILQKVERIKELIFYDELNLSEIADKLGYSGIAHMSAQFKQITGLTPSCFKGLEEKKRISLEVI